jgi:glycyl-tRNA synthetase
MKSSSIPYQLKSSIIPPLRNLSTTATTTTFATIQHTLTNRGFIYPCSSIYGGLSGSFDYGPLGSLMKRNISNSWWKFFISQRHNVVPLDSSILLSPKVWKASGHVDGFVDPLCECPKCDKRFRADHLIEKKLSKTTTTTTTIIPTQLPELIELVKKLQRDGIWTCPECGGGPDTILSLPRDFNLMFSTRVGAADGGEPAFFRPETAQGAYINLANIVTTSRKSKLPFGIAQIGKAFRNEVTPGNFIFRTREFEQMELQWFCQEKDSEKYHHYWLQECLQFLFQQCGINPANIRVRKHAKDELAHYAKGTFDIEYKFPFGWGELWGIADRGNHDIRAHEKASGHVLWSSSSNNNNNIEEQNSSCCIIEPSVGLNRLMLAILCDAYSGGAFESSASSNKQQRGPILKLKTHLAPYEIAIIPVVDKSAHIEFAQQIFQCIVQHWDDPRIDLDLTSGTVGKKYRRQDEIGTRFCIVVDDITLTDGSFTVRDRDTTKQFRVVDGLQKLSSKETWKKLLDKEFPSSSSY